MVYLKDECKAAFSASYMAGASLMEEGRLLQGSGPACSNDLGPVYTSVSLWAPHITLLLFGEAGQTSLTVVK